MAVLSRVRSLLAHGDRRTTGHVDLVVATVCAEPNEIEAVVQCVFEGEPAVRMRAADALEKISRKHAGLLQPYVALLLGLLEETEQPEVQWHTAVLLPRLALTPAQRSRVWHGLQRYLSARSSIVRTFALQGMADLSKQDASLVPPTMELLHVSEKTGTAAMKARSRKLLKELTTPRKMRRRNVVT